MACTYVPIPQCHWEFWQSISNMIWTGVAQDVPWYEYDPTATAAEVDSVYDDVDEVLYKAPVLLKGFFDPEPDAETRKKWGIVEKAKAALWLSVFLLDDAGHTITMRDKFVIDGVHYRIEQQDVPTDMGEREAVMMLGLRPGR